jgi:hypothetical protein
MAAPLTEATVPSTAQLSLAARLLKTLLRIPRVQVLTAEWPRTALMGSEPKLNQNQYNYYGKL